MAEDGSEEIMFICEWPSLSSSAGGRGAGWRGKVASSGPHCVFPVQKRCFFFG